jgi:DNA-binding protein H-NS
LRDSTDILEEFFLIWDAIFEFLSCPLETIDMASVSELLAQKAAIEQQIAEAQRAERAGAVAQVRALMAEHGLTLADLATKSAPSKRTGTKVAAKYRDASTGNTWSGRGLQPKWLKQALASGKKIEDFAL